jgi:hypothetical protein
MIPEQSCCRCLCCELGMAAWERGVVHEYAASKGLHHPTTEVIGVQIMPRVLFDWRRRLTYVLDISG